MDKVKLKNLIIAILLLANVFLLGLVIYNSRNQQDVTQLRSQALSAILQKHGITLAEGLELPDACGRVVKLERSLPAERRMLSALLGACSYADQGGNIYVFTGNGGTASISSGGEIKLALSTANSFSGSNIRAEAKSILNKLNIEYDVDSITQSVEDGLNCVTVTCLYDGSAVLNAKISLYFADGRFAFLQGRRLPDRAAGYDSADAELDAVSIIMAFLENIRKTGDVCSSITDLSTAYFLDSESVDSNKLTPVWRIETDTGAYFFDGVTGKARTAEG